ncbi:MAG: DoxX family protein [Verrucomicrobia bacterium]|nr:DoxX family protein [Verrucomicrobiota bacterium]
MKTFPTRAMLGLLGGIYIVAGALKIADPTAFARAITNYDLLPETLVPAVAVLLPWWEVVAGVLAIIGRWRGAALALIAGMSAVFLAASGMTLARGMSPECGCFGPLGGRLGATTLWVETAVLVAGIWLFRAETRDSAS